MGTEHVGLRLRGGITWLLGKHAQIAEMAFATASISGTIIALQSFDRFEDLWTRLIESSQILDRPFGAWSFAFLGELIAGLYMTLVLMALTVAHQALFVPTIFAATIGWLFRAIGKLRPA